MLTLLASLMALVASFAAQAWAAVAATWFVVVVGAVVMALDLWALSPRAARIRIGFKLRNLPHRLRGWRQELTAWAGFGGPALYLTLFRANGDVVPLGLVSRRVVTDAGVAYLVGCLRNLNEAENLNYHASGTGNTAEAAAQTALVTETGTRVAGTQSAPSANVYRTQATISYTGALAIVEHGVFSASTAGTLLDRSVFAAVNVVNGDSIQFTYDLTLTSGG
jgi:hypothetical protein